MDISTLPVPPGSESALRGRETVFQTDLTEAEARKRLEESQGRLCDLQERLYATEEYAVLILFQGMDASLKDESIKDITFALNPQICRAHAFKQPDGSELRHDYLWRFLTELPQRGHMAIFNRSYYEEIVTSRIHTERLDEQHLPEPCRDDVWVKRTRQINDLERYLVENGILLLKFFMNVSPDVQCGRLLERLEDPSKQWEFSASDIEERSRWDDYMRLYDEALAATSTEWAPWHIVPADERPFASCAVSETVAAAMERLGLEFPAIPPEEEPDRVKAISQLRGEGPAQSGW